jgi:predicted ATPase/DNA-binding SARP family transcriptional activator
VTIALRLLDEVSYAGEPIAGTRSGDLLAALSLHRSGLSDARLLAEVWGADQAPRTKALQVQVSRVRAQCGQGSIERYDGGYRLALADDAVDVWVVETLVDAARKALVDDDPHQALGHAVAADALVCAVGDATGDGPLADVRRHVRSLGPRLVRTHALALARCGLDAEAVPRLEAVHERDPDDVEVLEALLAGEAATAGAAAALARYEHYRRDLADRMGVDPEPTLQRAHRALMAADSPVRSGVQFDPDDLLGRAEDLAGLRGLVRTGRLTTVLGPGGLGKTRVAHVLAREATQPRVHFVELAGISSPADVVSEVGSALGVRHSVTGRRTLTAAQQADVRARVAQELDSVPTLLVLDNCEHVLDAAASLVAFLLVTTRDLRIVTTSRAPLGIAAERVYPLSQLAAADGAELFRRRARAVRPDAELPDDVVAEIVARLDGLPLAVELAAARIRTMSADEVRRALDDRFELLRGRDRSAPARHQTLTAVIAWSWDLLREDEQRALAWLSVFPDGFSLEGARDLLGRDGPDLVEVLVDQSLLTVAEHRGAMRYRMLETVREFGALRLARAGDEEAAEDALVGWAVGLATRLRPDLFGHGQVEAVDVLDTEETNLADVLRQRLLDGDAARAVPILASLGALWSVTGNFPRFLAMADLAERVLVDWEPPPELTEVTGEAVALVLVHLGFLRPEGVDELVAVMASLPEPTQPWSRVARAMFVGSDVTDRLAAVLRLTSDPDRRTVAMAWQWSAILAENEGAIEQAGEYVEQALALVDGDTTSWEIATLNTSAAMLALNAGDHERAAAHASTAIPLLHRLHAQEDAFSMQASLALSAMREGRLQEADRMLDEIGDVPTTDVTATLVIAQVRAELALVRGDVATGLASFDRSLAAARDWGFGELATNGLEPWTLIAVATDLAAHARYAETPAQRARGRELMGQIGDLLERFPSVPDGAVDYPITGMSLAAMGAWILSREAEGARAEPAVRLIALAHGFGYNRWFPVMDWDVLVKIADAAAPGRLAAVLEEYDGRQGRELRAEAELVLATVLGSTGVTSSG